MRQTETQGGTDHFTDYQRVNLMISKLCLNARPEQHRFSRAILRHHFLAGLGLGLVSSLPAANAAQNGEDT
jgi:hypothetical protein